MNPATETDRIRQIATVAGAVDAASESTGNAGALVGVHLQHEDFGAALKAELREIQKRLRQIDEDLSLLAYAPDSDARDLERYRLAHRGQVPATDADRAQLEAIEGRAAA